MDDGELHEEDDGGGLHSPGGVAYRWLGLQVVATRRRVGEALLVGSTVEEMDGWWRSLTNRGGGKEQSEGEWVRPFWSAQRWKRWMGGGAH
jgi:hypothetical protein